jgi:hypothetical protein
MSDPTAPSSVPFAVPDELPGLDALEARLVNDLVATQGAARATPTTTALRIVLPLVVVVCTALYVLPALRGVSASVVVVGLATVCALAGLAVAPARPGRGERLAQLSVVVAVVGFALELARTVPGGMAGAGTCFTMTGSVGLVAVVAAGLGVSASGLPLRLWHGVGLGIVGILGACTAVWHHCESDALGHVMLAHVVGPLALVVVVVTVARWLVSRAAQRPLSGSAHDTPPTV